MAAKHPHDVSDEIYHRIYRLIKRRITPHNIAATLNLPLRTVLGVISRLEKTEAFSEQQYHSRVTKGDLGSCDFLDIYFYPKTRYAVIHLVGYLSEKYTSLLETEINKALTSNWKAVALRMSDIRFICEDAAKVLFSCKDHFDSMGRYFAILDPSPEIESALAAFKIETFIPIFGTERAFEEAAFSRKEQRFSRHRRSESL